ncbi:MAG TPA: aminoglycoside phosphotransferase family protein [Fimbriimonadaceae bacterium]|jgi:streptomycin 6-kinase
MDSTKVVASRLALEWVLELNEALPGATCSYIFAGRDKDGQEVVLKVPEAHAEEKDSWPVSQSFSGHGGVSILRVDQESGSVLMPRLRPGTTLADTTLPDEERVEICASIILKLRKSPFVQTMSMERWLKELFEFEGDSLLREAQEIAKFLMQTTTDPILLHGDLHHYNILRDGEEWRVIDPKGIIGDRAFEVVSYMRNPWHGPHQPRVMAARLELFSKLLGDDLYRLWGWSFVQTLLCSLQSDGDPFDPLPMREAAEAIYAARPG